MPTPFFSIVIPALNEERALPLLLEDIKAQTFKEFEVFVVDGNSDDKTPSIVKKLAAKDKNFHLLTSKKRNVGYQRNLGAQKSKGNYLLFLDADDRIPSYFLSGIHYHCTKDVQVDGFTTYIEPDTDNAKDKVFTTFLNTMIETSVLMKQPHAYGACIGVKRAVFEEINGFDESVTFGEDSEFVLRLAKAGFFFTVFREPTFVYSLRRFRKEGTLKLIRKLGPMALKNMRHEKITEDAKDAYPMLGGSYFEEETKKATPSTIKQIRSLMKTLREMLTS